VTLRADRGSLIGEGTTDEADIRHCVIGAGVRIDRDVTLERCVVWNGTDVPKGTFVDSILTPQQTVSATN
jgi:ADP-glucose pyrophosphorylase